MTLTPESEAPAGLPSTRFPFAIDGNVFGWASGVEATKQALDVFHDAGGRLISTADHYAGGRSEIMIGNWVRDAGVRSSVFLATKIGRHPDAPGLSPESIVAATEASLQRLQTDHIDLLVFDGDCADVPMEESFRAVSALVESGKVAAVAASSYSGDGLVEARRITENDGLPGFRAVFSPYSLMERRRVESDIGPAARSMGIGIFARLPLAKGFLTGDYQKYVDGPESLMFQEAKEYEGRRGMGVLKVLEKVSAETNESVAACALAWVRSKPGIIAPVLRAASAAQVTALVGSIGLVLEPHQVDELDRASQ